MSRAVLLKYHTLEDRFGDTVTVAEAIDLTTREPVASYSLEMMYAWLKLHGFRWRFGSSGIWEAARALIVSSGWRLGQLQLCLPP